MSTLGGIMRRFKWRLFERKGSYKEVKKDEKLLRKNLEDIKSEILRREKPSIGELVKEVLM
jgi:hypothetical protein